MTIYNHFDSAPHRKIFILVCILFLGSSCNTDTRNAVPLSLKVSDNHRFLSTEKNDPFFWLGDTGWLLFTKLTREETEIYLEDRHRKGFNVIQVMVLHDLKHAVNVYGDSALINNRIDQPKTTPGSSFEDPAAYDFWDHIDYLIDLAGKKGLYMALVPVWGSNVRAGMVNSAQAEKYAAWIAKRYHNRTNVIWLNGGDVRGSDSTEVWKTIGSTISQANQNQLITYHPFGRTQSSEWFHNEPWLDFNMFQSGHRRYDQDTTGRAYGEDNWKYANVDYSLLPVKPVIDGEPSYEGIPQGLHDATQPFWTDADVRRYAYWSVFAGCFGFTYGHSAIMQFYRNGDNPEYGARIHWDVALGAPGASQMKYLKELILSKPFFERVPANNLLAGTNGLKYDYIAVTRGNNYVLGYTCNGSDISLNLKELGWSGYNASWFNPRSGIVSGIGSDTIAGVVNFDPPGVKEPGNDWVLVLEKK